MGFSKAYSKEQLVFPSCHHIVNVFIIAHLGFCDLVSSLQFVLLFNLSHKYLNLLNPHCKTQNIYYNSFSSSILIKMDIDSIKSGTICPCISSSIQGIKLPSPSNGFSLVAKFSMMVLCVTQGNQTIEDHQNHIEKWIFNHLDGDNTYFWLFNCHLACNMIFPFPSWSIASKV